MLFGVNPQKFFLQTLIKAIRFRGYDVTEDMLDFKTIEGDILIQFEKAEDFIFEHIPKQAWIEEGKLQRQEKWLYPPKAIREALANFHPTKSSYCESLLLGEVRRRSRHRNK